MTAVLMKSERSARNPWLAAGLVGIAVMLLAILLWGTVLGAEFRAALATWNRLDTWIVITGACAAMACALPGNYLVLRRQSMMGDALSHTVLLGIVLAILGVQLLRASGVLTVNAVPLVQPAFIFAGSLIVGVLSAVLTEWIQRLGRVEASASLGVVFTSCFALALLLVRLLADSVHVDPDCVLMGTLEVVAMDTLGTSGVPRAAAMTGAMTLGNLLLLVLFFKELRISAFDPSLATALGINARLMHYGLMGITAATVVAAFESVGSILVIAMLIIPPAAAYMLTDRLSVMAALSVLIAAASALLGHVMAITLPAMIFSRLGYPEVLDASTAGMMAVAAGLLFVLAVLFGPRHGVLSKIATRLRLSLRIAAEDVLGVLYRLEERQHLPEEDELAAAFQHSPGHGGLIDRLAIARLRRAGLVRRAAGGLQLTDAGRSAATELVRSHRLWETFLAKHFEPADDLLHRSATRAEHFLDQDMRGELAEELDRPAADPHGSLIPPERNQGGRAKKDG